MATFFMLGRYSAEGLKGITTTRTQKARDLVKELGGEIQSIHALLGEHDLAIVVDLPNLDAALRASVQLGRLTNVAFSTCPAFTAEQFDKLTS